MGHGNGKKEAKGQDSKKIVIRKKKKRKGSFVRGIQILTVVAFPTGSSSGL